MILTCTTEFINIENVMDIQMESDKKFFLDSFRQMNDSIYQLRNELGQVNKEISKLTGKKQTST